MPKNQIPVYMKGRGIVANIKVVPNQKVIEVHKVHGKGSRILDIQTNRQAQKELSPQAYVLYMHFVLSLPNYTEALSLEYITQTTSLSERGYYKAVNELIEKKYLIQKPSKEYSEFYHFYEQPTPRENVFAD